MLPEMSTGKLIAEGCWLKALHGHNLLNIFIQLKSYLTTQFRLTIFPVFRCRSLVSFWCCNDKCLVKLAHECRQRALYVHIDGIVLKGGSSGEIGRISCGKGAKMKRNSGVREMEPVKCRVTEVASPQDSVMLGTYGEIMSRSLAFISFDERTSTLPHVRYSNSHVPKLWAVITW
jgi:hypothetical protein